MLGSGDSIPLFDDKEILAAAAAVSSSYSTGGVLISISLFCIEFASILKNSSNLCFFCFKGFVKQVILN